MNAQHLPITLRRLSIRLMPILALALITCSGRQITGSGTEEGNVVTGMVIDTAGNPAAGAVLTLVPADYNPLSEKAVSATLTDTSDAAGRFRICARIAGTYTLEAQHPHTRTMALVSGIRLNNDTAKIENRVMKRPGSIRVFVPAAMSGLRPVAFIKGTTFVRPVQISSDSDPSMYIDSLPESLLPALHYADGTNLSAQYRLTDTISIVSGDTGETDAFTTWKQYTGNGSGVHFDRVVDMVIAANGTKWFSLFDQGIAASSAAQWTIYDDNNAPLPSSSPRTIDLQADGTIWASFYKGVSRYTGGIWTSFTPQNSVIPTDAVTDVTCGLGDTVWVGTQDGAVRFDGSGWELFDTLSCPLPSNQINSICIDGGNNAWFATPKGAVAFDGTSWTIYDQSGAALFSDYVWMVFVDAESNVWLTHEGGVTVKRGESWTRYSSDACSLLENVVWNMTQDRAGIYWFCTDKGLASFDGTTWKIYGGKRYPLLDSVEIYAIAEDGDGTMWICTGGRGIITFGSSIYR